MTSPDDAVWTTMHLVHLDVLGDDAFAGVRFINDIDDIGLARQVAVILLELVGEVFERYVPPEEHELRINELIDSRTPKNPEGA